MALNQTLMVSNHGGLTPGITPRIFLARRKNLVILTQLKLPIVWVVKKNTLDMQVFLQITADSFREMYEANSSTFKPADGELPNTMLRFDLESIKSKSTYFSNNSEFNVLGASIILSFCVGGIYLYSQSEAEAKQENKMVKAGDKLNQSKSQILVGLDSTSKRNDLEILRKKSEENILLDYELKVKEERSMSKISKGTKTLSEKEQRLKKLAPDLSALNPDEE